MDLYRVVLCFFPEDERLAASFFGLAGNTPECQHMPLPDPRARMCCRPRRVFHRVVRSDGCDRIPPRKKDSSTTKKKRDQPMPAIWSQTPELTRRDRRMDDLYSGSSSPQTLDLTESARQLHRLGDFFSPADETKQLEVICCFTNPSLMEADESGCDCLFSALLRMVEYQNSHLTFVCPDGEEANFQDSHYLPRQWLQKLSGRLVFVSEETDQQGQAIPTLPTFWRGGIRLSTDQNCPIGGRVRGFQLLRLDDAKVVEPLPDDYCVPVSPCVWLDVVKEVAIGDVCPLVFSDRRWSLCVQSEWCSDAHRLISALRGRCGAGGALLCRLGLFPGDSSLGGRSTGLGDFIPGSEQWLAQLNNELRGAADAPKPSPLALQLLLLPSPSRLLALGLRQFWELPLPALSSLATLAEREEDEEEGEAWRRWGDDLPVARTADAPRCRLAELPTRGPTEAALRVASVALLLEAVVGRVEAEEAEEEGPGRRQEARKATDHLVEQMLKCFRADGSPALEPTEQLMPERRPLIDEIVDQSQLHWPKAANIFYHGIDYSRGAWCDAREERLAKVRGKIQHETMCTVTRFGCRGNAAAVPAPAASPRPAPARRAGLVSSEPLKQMVVRDRTAKKETKAPRSVRHAQKLREVVARTLKANGVSKSHASYNSLSDNLFEATKTIIKMQNLPNSHNLKEKMAEVAQLQFQVMKQLMTI